MKPILMTCKLCYETIYSRWSGEFVSCKCRSCMIDQSHYMSRYLGDPENYIITLPTITPIEEWWDKYYGVDWRQGLLPQKINSVCKHANYPFQLQTNVLDNGFYQLNKKQPFIHQYMLKVIDKCFSPYVLINDEGKEEYYAYVSVQKYNRRYYISVAGCDDCSYTKKVKTLDDVLFEIKALHLLSQAYITTENKWFFSN